MKKQVFLFSIFIFTQIAITKAEADTNTRWYCYPTAVESGLGFASRITGEFLFPDSSVLMTYGKYLGYCSISTLFDPKSGWYYLAGDHTFEIDKDEPYILDSVAFNFLYKRNISDINIVDTLIFEFVMSDYMETFFIDHPQYADSVLYKEFKYKTNTDGHDLQNKIITVKYALTIADTASQALGNQQVKIGLPQPKYIEKNKMIGVNIKFKPGYTYTNTDSLMNLNFVKFISYEENGLASMPGYAKGDWSCSSTYSVYNKFYTSNSYFGCAVPSYAQVSAFSFENHWIEFHVTSTVDINEKENNQSPIIINYPNPATDLTNIEYQLKQKSNVSLSLYDITGKLIKKIDEGKKNTGKYYITIDISSLQSGSYYFVLKTDTNKETRKLLVY